MVNKKESNIIDCHAENKARNDAKAEFALCRIIDCHENFTNFLAMTNPRRHCEALAEAIHNVESHRVLMLIF
ncbi:MAG: hypothetical protein HDT10_08145 [Helicobacter sp.]|nr:hypothetical protein [Helicobacter sp.]